MVEGKERRRTILRDIHTKKSRKDQTKELKITMHPGDHEPTFAQDISSLIDNQITGHAGLTVSPAFYPGAFDEISDTVFLSSDSVLFYIHAELVTRTQPNTFRRLRGAPLTDPAYRDHIINVEERADVLAVMLHALYDTQCSPVPPFEAIVNAVDKMRMYEISPSVLLTPQANLYKLVLSFAPVVPLEVYALASLHMLNDLAVESSSHLISYPLSAITDGMAARIGTSYLLRLFQWRLHRTSEMKIIVLKPPYLHPPTQQCPLNRQRHLTEIWADVSARVVHGDITDLTLSFLRSLAEPHLEKLECDMCKEIIQDKVRDVVVEWNAVPRTIPPGI